MISVNIAFSTMGGFGSSRWFLHDAKTPVERCRSFSVADLRRVGKLTGRVSDVLQWFNLWGEETSTIAYACDTTNPANAWIRLTYHFRRSAVNADYQIRVTRTPVPWGAWRWWFCCPHCDRRCSVLYL